MWAWNTGDLLNCCFYLYLFLGSKYLLQLYYVRITVDLLNCRFANLQICRSLKNRLRSCTNAVDLLNCNFLFVTIIGKQVLVNIVVCAISCWFADYQFANVYGSFPYGQLRLIKSRVRIFNRNKVKRNKCKEKLKSADYYSIQLNQTLLNS